MASGQLPGSSAQHLFQRFTEGGSQESLEGAQLKSSLSSPSGAPKGERGSQSQSVAAVGLEGVPHYRGQFSKGGAL